MSEQQDFSTKNKPTWCPGCGDFGIWASIKNAFVKMNWDCDSALVVYGIGCHGHMVNFLKIYGFEGLHGRPVPVAVGAKLANHKLKVIVVTGDGDTYGEGIGHLISAIRANNDITCIVHNNEVYGLTIGQKSPTAEKGFKTKSTPQGVIEVPLNPLNLALSLDGSFISRGFAGDMDHLTNLIIEGINHPGFSLVDVLQPCVTFDKVHTYPWYRERIYKLSDTDYKPVDKVKSFEKAMEWGDKIPIGVFYKDEKRLSYEANLPQLSQNPLNQRDITNISIDKLLDEFS
jgi:2-oxoglutarate ferredoxin oxidoreductase subunit beta